MSKEGYAIAFMGLCLLAYFKFVNLQPEPPKPETAAILEFLDKHQEMLVFYPEDAVRCLQRALNSEVNYQLEVDGILGKQTIEAYDDWHSANK